MVFCKGLATQTHKLPYVSAGKPVAGVTKPSAGYTSPIFARPKSAEGQKDANPTGDHR